MFRLHVADAAGAEAGRPGIPRPRALRRSFERSACGSPSPTCSCTAHDRAHPLQHARAVDVRHRARADVGHARRFLRYYFATGIAAAITTIVVSLVPFAATARMFYTVDDRRIGRDLRPAARLRADVSERPIYMYFVFPIPAKYFVMIMGAIALLSSMGDSGGGIAHITHLGGLVAGYRHAARPAPEPGERSALSLSALEDGSREEEVRRAHRREERLGQANSLKLK